MFDRIVCALIGAAMACNLEPQDLLDLVELAHLIEEVLLA